MLSKGNSKRDKRGIRQVVKGAIFYNTLISGGPQGLYPGVISNSHGEAGPGELPRRVQLG